ncbi:toprim domain-containing protein [Kribbella sp. NPDC006257]|uniref:toprim domain-containing protein n=1 Tax=Kribbella sp. NPDC006257 TaxID=3156738 RepID=UPI0033A413E4
MSRLLEVQRAARAFYRSELEARPDGWAVRHLTGRGLRASLADQHWSIGYAPDSWRALVDHLRREGFADEALIGAGLASPTINGYLVDRFRDRIMFAADDGDLEPVGFVGRARADRIRYLNSPTTAIYSKSETVVGLGAQRGKLLRGAVPVLVEGPIDALAVDQVGRSWAGISSAGVAVSVQQALMIRRWAPQNRVVVAFDSDLGGRLGAVRSLDVLSQVFADVSIAEFPGGQDPASCFTSTPAGLATALTTARPLAEFAIDFEVARWEKVLDHISGQVNALRAVAPLVRRLPSDRIAQQIVRLSQRLNLEVDVVSREVLTPVSRAPSRRASSRRRDPDDPEWPNMPSRTP